jgi:hypothetical protein
MARVTGIVRRPYPSASDQRYALTPRMKSDLGVLGAAVAPGPSTGETGRARGSGNSPSTRDPAGASPGGTTTDVDLVDLAAMIGQTVRVGGLVVDLRPDGVLLDDGTAVGVIVIRGEALGLLPLLEPDDAINAIGRVERQPDGPVVVVEDPGGIAQAGDPTAAEPGPTSPVSLATPGDPSAADSPSGHQAGLLDWPVGIGAGLGSLIGLSLLSLAITVGRRAHARRRLEATIAARVVAFGASAGPSLGPRLAERDDGRFHSA